MKILFSIVVTLAIIINAVAFVADKVMKARMKKIAEEQNKNKEN